MKKYRLTLLIPSETIFEAEDLGKAHTEAERLSKINYSTEDNAINTLLHSVIEIKDNNVVDFGPSPAAA